MDRSAERKLRHNHATLIRFALLGDRCERAAMPRPMPSAGDSEANRGRFNGSAGARLSSVRMQAGDGRSLGWRGNSSVELPSNSRIRANKLTRIADIDLFCN
jgi:hypothetical protein